jgi:hypothetical protein
MNALRDDNGQPPENLTRALIFEAVIACIAAPALYFIKPKEGRLAKDINARYQK